MNFQPFRGNSYYIELNVYASGKTLRTKWLQLKGTGFDYFAILMCSSSSNKLKLVQERVINSIMHNVIGYLIGLAYLVNVR